MEFKKKIERLEVERDMLNNRMKKVLDEKSSDADITTFQKERLTSMEDQLKEQ